MRNRQFQKNNKKIKKYHYEFISSQNWLEIDEKERNKNYRSIPFRSNPMCNRKFQTNRKKLQKNLKNAVVASFQTKIGWKRMRKREKIKIILPFHSYPRRDRKFQKNSKN